MSRVCGGSSVWVLSFEQLRSQHNFTVVRNVFIIGVASTWWSQRLVYVCCSSVDEILVACRYDSVVVTTKRGLNDLELVEVDDEVDIDVSIQRNLLCMMRFTNLLCPLLQHESSCGSICYTL